MSELTTHQILIYIMVAACVADREVNDLELEKIRTIIRALPVFDTYDGSKLAEDCQACGKILKSSGGLTEILATSHNVLPERLFETAYALAVDVSVADFYFKREETRFAQMLAEELDIDEATCSAIRVAARARHRRL